jgi:hypothetical protein
MDKLKKIMQKSIFSLFTLCFFLLSSCEESDTFAFREGIKEDVAAKNEAAAEIEAATKSNTTTENNGQATGQATFWLDSNINLANGNITVTCNGSYKTISGSSSSTPDCGASGTATFTLKPGTYSYSASAGTKTWNGEIKVTSGVCTKQKIEVSLDGKWKNLSDGLTLTVSGSNATIYSLGTGMWKTAGNVGYALVGGEKWTSISKGNSLTWNYRDLFLVIYSGSIIGTSWSGYGTIVMNTNGQTITTTATDPISGISVSTTYTKVN